MPEALPVPEKKGDAPKGSFRTAVISSTDREGPVAHIVAIGREGADDFNLVHGILRSTQGDHRHSVRTGPFGPDRQVP